MLTDIFEIDQEVYTNILGFNIKTGNNVLVLGMAGTGKTEMAQDACKKAGFESIYLNLSVLEAPDLIGLPTITRVEGQSPLVEYAAPKFLPSMDRTPKPVVLIVDELDKAKPELQNPLLELFQFHSVNGTKLNIQAIIATGNLPDEGSFSQPISHALTNRCKVYKVRQSFESWRQWAQDANINALVVGFLSKNQEYLARPAVDGDPTAYCRPSPRAWAMAARELDQTSTQDTVEFQTLIVAGRVGMAAATKFRVWLDHYRHVEPLITKLVEKGEHPNVNDLSIDRQLVCAIAAVNEVASIGKQEPKDAKGKTKQEEDILKVAKNVFGWVKKLPAEFQIAAVKSTLNMGIITTFKLTKVPEVMETYLNVRKAMKD